MTPTEIQVAGSVSGTVKLKNYETGGEDALPETEKIEITLRNSRGEVVGKPVFVSKDGSYAFDGLLEGGEYTVTAVKQDGQKMRFVNNRSEEQEVQQVTLGSGAARFPTADFVLEAPHTVTFVVDGPEGTYTATDMEPQKIWHGDTVPETDWPTVTPITG